MFKKKTSLNIRPEPPSVAEITEDINSADSSDVVFARSNNELLNVIESSGDGAEPAMLTQQPGLSRTSSSSAVSQSLVMTSDSESRDASVDLVYHQATEFISLTEQLKQGLSDEQSQQKRLHDACVRVTECLESMRRTVSDLRARTSIDRPNVS